MAHSRRLAVALVLSLAVAAASIALAHRGPTTAREGDPLRRPDALASQVGAKRGDKSEPGRIKWAFAAGGEIVGAPAIATVGGSGGEEESSVAIHVATRAGMLYSIDGSGAERWRYDYAAEMGVAPISFEAAPAVGDDGTVYIGDDIWLPNYVIAVHSDGRLRWDWQSGDVYSAIDASPALDGEGRVFCGGHAGGFGWSGGSVYGFNGNGSELTGFPIVTGPVRSSGAALGDGRTVVFADAGVAIAPRTATANPTVATPSAPPPSDTPPASATSPTPTGGTSTATPTGTEATAPASPTPSPSPTPGRAALHLPRALVERADGGTTYQSARPAQAMAWLPSRIHVVADGRAPGRAFDLPPGGFSSPAVADGIAIVWMRQHTGAPGERQTGDPVLAAFDLSDPVRQIWQAAVPGELSAAPVVGDVDPETMSAPLFYNDPAGRVYAWRVHTVAGSAPWLVWSADVPPLDEHGSALGFGGPAIGARAADGGDVLYVPCGADGDGAQIVAFDTRSGERLWSTTLVGERISSAVNLGPDGTLYVGTRRGTLYAIETESSGLSPTAQWPAFRADERNTGRAADVTLGPTPTPGPTNTRVDCPIPPFCTPGPPPTPGGRPTPICPPCRTPRPL